MTKFDELISRAKEILAQNRKLNKDDVLLILRILIEGLQVIQIDGEVVSWSAGAACNIDPGGEVIAKEAGILIEIINKLIERIKKDL